MRADIPTDKITTPIKSVQNPMSCNVVFRLRLPPNWLAENRMTAPTTIIKRSILLLHQSANLPL